jgi:hypothetical protein
VGHRLRILKAIYTIIKDHNLDIKDHYVPPSKFSRLLATGRRHFLITLPANLSFYPF